MPWENLQAEIEGEFSSWLVAQEERIDCEILRRKRYWQSYKIEWMRRWRVAHPREARLLAKKAVLSRKASRFEATKIKRAQLSPVTCICGNWFTPLFANKLYCSLRCKEVADMRRQNRQRFVRSRVNKLCLSCRVWFSPLRTSSRFCMLKCQKTFGNKKRCYVNGERAVKKYYDNPTPGEFDHRGGDCPTHGPNVAVYRQKGFLGPFFCVACSLVLEKEQVVT